VEGIIIIMEGSLKMILNFVVFLFAIMIGLMGSAYGTRPGIRYEPYQFTPIPSPACYWVWGCKHPPTLKG
jgi:hypothetical protein